MITFWKQDEGLKQTTRLERDGWVSALEPTAEDIVRLTDEFKVPDYLISDLLDPDERARTEIDGRWMVVIIRVPIYNKSADVAYYTVPLGVLISLHTIVTICMQQNEIIKEIQNSPKTKDIQLKDKVNFVLQLFLSSANYYLRYLKEINKLTNEIEAALEKSARNVFLHRLLDMEKSLVLFMTSLKTNELLLMKLQRSKLVNSQEFNEELLDDVTIEYQQALEITKVYSDIQSGRMETFASVISNNLNVVMRRLTSITIVLMVPTLVASFYGMNVPNGLENNPLAFIGIVVLTTVISVLGVFWLKKRDMF
ncbi:MAG: magnesium transporter CorA family protein [Bacteroidales bacterium]|jgi:magnesium transporter|nr:magnesium transporter CorA family protein [Bacteroidales bacterium]MBQ7214056.1 magnesium transporter CorA family protein [Bacteroidales bacterium]MBR3287691.1 magnesium transporter CorA family protein [Bacteroidales bacterium]MCR5715199.1 magnesium transporter CorA family protein [Bacteroidales bacterium]